MEAAPVRDLRPATTPTEDARLEAWRALISAHASLVARVEEALADDNLPPLAWYDVLCALDRAEGPGMRPRELGLHVTISKSGLTRLVDRIVAAGFIERRACDSDRRGHTIVLTDSGRAMLKEMQPAFAQIHEAAFASQLSEDEARMLSGLLNRLQESACSGRGDC
jgi:DNA-binding MarR family transcriptional regulator